MDRGYLAPRETSALPLPNPSYVFGFSTPSLNLVTIPNMLQAHAGNGPAASGADRKPTSIARSIVCANSPASSADEKLSP